MEKTNQYVSNFCWRLMERWGAQIVSLVVTMVLARLLDPSENGIVAIVSVFISLCSIFVDGGFGAALIQKKSADDLDFSSVFYFNLVCCGVLYGVLYVISPFIAEFYRLPVLVTLIRVQGISLLVSGVTSIQNAYIAKYMLFKRHFFASFGGTIAGAVVGILLAYSGYGVWALVAQSLAGGFLSMCILWITVKWRPKQMFSAKRLKQLFSYGSKLLLSNLLYTGYADMRQLIIGKFFSTADLAYYNKAYTVPSMLNTGISSSISSILVPAMVDVQGDSTRIKRMMKRTLLLHSYVLCPVFVGLLVCSKPVVFLIFSEKWLPSVPYLQLFCLIYILDGIGIVNLNAYKAIGRSDLTLKIECVKTPLYILLLLVAIPFGIMAVAHGAVVGTTIAQFFTALPSKKLFGYPLSQQLRDMLPHLLLSAMMGVCVWLVSLLNLHYLVTLLIQIPLGVIIYIAGSYVLKLEAFSYLLNRIKLFSK